MGQGIGSGFKTVGQGIGGGVKKILPGEKPDLLRTPGFVPEGAKAAGDVGGGGILPSIARPDAAMPLRTPDVGGRGILPISPTPFAVEQSNAPITPMLPRPTPPAMAAPTQGIVPTAPQMPGQMPSAREVAPPMDMDRRNVMLPALPGESGPKDYSRTEAARYDYHRSRMKQPGEEGYDGTGQYKRSGKDILRNALMGFFQGAASDPRNPLAAGLGGAMVGGTGTAISPQGGAEYGFNTMVRPQVDRQMVDEAVNQKLKDEQLSREQAAQRAKWEAEARPLQIESERADLEYKRNRANAPIEVSPGATLYGRDGKPIATAPPLPQRQGTQARPPGLISTREGIYDPVARQWVERYGNEKPPSRQDAMDEVLADDGSIESIAQSSLEGRLDSLKQQLTAQERAMLDAPPSAEQLKARLSPEQRAVIEGGSSGNSNFDASAYAAWERLQQGAAADTARVRDKWDQIQRRELDKITRETKGEAARKAATRRTSGARPKLPAPQGQAPTTRPRSQFNSQKFPGLKFD